MALFGPPDVAVLAAKRDVKRLVRALSVASVRRDAVVALGQIGDTDAVPPLIVALRDPDPVVRQASAWSLGLLADARAVEPLIGQLAYDPAQQVRDSSSAALQALGNAAVQPLLTALRAEDPAVRQASAHVLGLIRDRRAVEPLIALLTDGTSAALPPVRVAAAEALGGLGDARAVEPLIAALREGSGYSHRELGCASAEALARLGDARVIEPLVTILATGDDHDVRDACEAALCRIGPPAVDGLINAVQDGRGLARYTATRTLGRIGDARAVEPLIVLLHDDPSYVEDVAEALGRIGDPRAVGPLVHVLRDTPLLSDTARPVIVAAFGRLGVPAAVSLLDALHEEGAHRPREFVNRDMAQALGAVGAPALGLLIEAVHDADAFVRCTAADALGRIDDPRTVEPLRACLGDSDELVRATAAVALRSAGQASTPDPTFVALREAVEPLLGCLYYGYGRCNVEPYAGSEYEARDELAALLERSAADMDADLLRQVFGLPDELCLDSLIVDGDEYERILGFVELKQRARDELVRRGVAAWTGLRPR